MSHDSFVWDVTHSYETWLIHTRTKMRLSNRLLRFVYRSGTCVSYVTCLIHMRHDSFVWDMPHSYETWLIHMRHDSFTRERRCNCPTVDCILCSETNDLWVMSHMDESCLTDEWVMVTSHMDESCLIWMSHVSYEWVMSYMNESCLIWLCHVSYEWVMSHMNQSCLIWMSHVLIWMSHVSYNWFMSHMNESNLKWMMSHASTRLDLQWGGREGDAGARHTHEHA